MTETRQEKSADAFRTISEVSSDLDVPQHVLRFWETKFTQVKPMKRAGGRRYYRPQDSRLLERIRDLLYSEGYTIRGVQKLLKEKGIKAFTSAETGPDVGIKPQPQPQPQPQENETSSPGAAAEAHHSVGSEVAPALDQNRSPNIDSSVASSSKTPKTDPGLEGADLKIILEELQSIKALLSRSP